MNWEMSCSSLGFQHPKQVSCAEHGRRKKRSKGVARLTAWCSCLRAPGEGLNYSHYQSLEGADVPGSDLRDPEKARGPHLVERCHSRASSEGPSAQFPTQPSPAQRWAQPVMLQVWALPHR